MAIFTESTLSDSYIYSIFDNNKTISSGIAGMLKSATRVSPNMIETQLLQIKNTRLSPLWNDVITAYNSGKLLLLYNKVINIPTSIPYVVVKLGNDYTPIVILNRFGSFNKEGDVFNIQFKDLYVLMESAYVAARYYLRPQNITRNAGLMRFCSGVYTEMFRRVLARDVSLVTNLTLQAQVVYSVARFFIEHVWDLMSEGAAHNYALNIAGRTMDTDMNIIKSQYESANIMTVEELIAFLHDLSPVMSLVQKKQFIERWINTFGAAAILGMDCLPYFLFILQCTLLGSFLITQPIMSDIAKNSRGLNAGIFYPELNRSIT